MTKTQTENGLYFKHWPCANDCQAIVLLIHGLGEHCERYGALAAALNDNGYALYSMDLPGHGQSAGERGHIGSFDEFVNAGLSLHKKITTQHPGKDVFLLGHSMGGLIAARFLQEHPTLFKGALLSGAAIESHEKPPALQVTIVNLLAKLFPTLKITELDASGISRDPQVVNTYMNDPLVNKGKLSARFLSELFANMQTCRERAKEITLPIFIMHGSEDVMTAPAGSQLMHDSVSSADKSLKIYSGLYHEIFNEPEQAEVYADVVAWLKSH